MTKTQVFHKLLTSAIGVVVLALSLPALASPSKASAQSSIAEAFRTCVDMNNNKLASALLATVWDYRARGSFPKKFGALAQGLALTDEGDNMTTARIKLVSPETAVVEGVAPQFLSATTCPDGCGVAVFALEFGMLSKADKAKLAKWVKSAPASRDEFEDEPRKVMLHTKNSGAVSLICDLGD